MTDHEKAIANGLRAAAEAAKEPVAELMRGAADLIEQLAEERDNANQTVANLSRAIQQDGSRAYRILGV